MQWINILWTLTTFKSIVKKQKKITPQWHVDFSGLWHNFLPSPSYLSNPQTRIWGLSPSSKHQLSDRWRIKRKLFGAFFLSFKNPSDVDTRHPKVDSSTKYVYNNKIWMNSKSTSVLSVTAFWMLLIVDSQL